MISVAKHEPACPLRTMYKYIEGDICPYCGVPIEHKTTLQVLAFLMDRTGIEKQPWLVRALREQNADQN